MSREPAVTRTGPSPNGAPRCVQIRIPNLNSPAFRAEAHRQSLTVAASCAEKDDQDFIDALSDRH